MFVHVLYAVAHGAPLLLAVAWWRWWRDDRTRYSGWRAVLLLIGLASASAVVATFWISAGTRGAIGPGTQGSMVVYMVAGQLTFLFSLVALFGTLLGKGRGRLLALIATFAGFVLWLPIAF